MGARTRQQLNDEVFLLFGESAGHVTTTQVDAWLQEGYTQFAYLSESLVDYKALDVSSSVAVLPPGFKYLLDIDTGNVPVSSEHQLGSGIITFRAGAGSPAPSTINIRYVATPSSDSTATFPQMTTSGLKTALSEYGDVAVVQFALSRAFRRDNRTEEQVQAMNEFNSLAQTEYRNTAPLRARKALQTDAWSGRAKGSPGYYHRYQRYGA